IISRNVCGRPSSRTMSCFRINPASSPFSTRVSTQYPGLPLTLVSPTTATENAPEPCSSRVSYRAPAPGTGLKFSAITESLGSGRGACDFPGEGKNKAMLLKQARAKESLRILRGVPGGQTERRADMIMGNPDPLTSNQSPTVSRPSPKHLRCPLCHDSVDGEVLQAELPPQGPYQSGLRQLLPAPRPDKGWWHERQRRGGYQIRYHAPRLPARFRVRLPCGQGIAKVAGDDAWQMYSASFRRPDPGAA